MNPITREQAAAPARYEFQAQDDTWHPFIDQKHYENTKAGGRWPIRALYTREQVIADLARESGAMPEVQRADVGYIADVCFSDEVRESIASLQAKIEQVTAELAKVLTQGSDSAMAAAERRLRYETMDKLEQSEARVRELEDALDFYARYILRKKSDQSCSILTPIDHDCGDRARAALNKEPGHEA